MPSVLGSMPISRQKSFYRTRTTNFRIVSLVEMERAFFVTVSLRVFAVCVTKKLASHALFEARAEYHSTWFTRISQRFTAHSPRGALAAPVIHALRRECGTKEGLPLAAAPAGVCVESAHRK